jgi:Bacterial SH3 domain
MRVFRLIAPAYLVQLKTSSLVNIFSQDSNPVKYQRKCPSRIVTAAFITTAMTLFATPSLAINTSRNLVGTHSSQAASFSGKPVQLAQTLEGCRQVVAQNGLYVRAEPTVYSEARGIINYGRNVTVAPGRVGRWVRISAPMEGYVYSGWLGTCETAATPYLDNCRLVMTDGDCPSVNRRQ